MIKLVAVAALLAAFEYSFFAASRVVTSVGQLDAAVSGAAAGDEIILQPGVYQLTRTVTLSKSNIVLRGSSGKREDVVLRGGGMNTRGVDEGISVSASGIKIRDLTLEEFYFNGIHTRAELDVDRCTISNVKTMNIGERHIKGSRDPGSQTKMSDDFVIERVLMVQTKARTGHSDTSPDYIGGIDMMAMNNLVIRDCRAEGIVGSQNGGNAAIFLWQGIQNVTIERNQIVGCAKGIALGNPAPPATNLPTGAWHCDGAVIRNNMLLRGVWTTGNNIALELASAKNVLCAYNTFYSSQADYFRVLSFSESPPGVLSEISLRHNIIRGRVFDQTDGSGWNSVGDIMDGAGTIVVPAWFIAPAAGDLHLTPSASRAIDAGFLVPGIEQDFDRDKRPEGLRPDIGADELKSADSDADGIPDRSETLSEAYQVGADDSVIDSDADGASNADEYYAGTNPLDAASALRLSLGEMEKSEFAFTFPAVAGRRYEVQYTYLSNPMSWRAEREILGSNGTVQVKSPLIGSGRFYRIAAEPGYPE